MTAAQIVPLAAVAINLGAAALNLWLAKRRLRQIRAAQEVPTPPKPRRVYAPSSPAARIVQGARARAEGKAFQTYLRALDKETLVELMLREGPERPGKAEIIQALVECEHEAVALVQYSDTPLVAIARFAFKEPTPAELTVLNGSWPSQAGGRTTN